MEKSIRERCILHCDLNNFYASVECLYRPEIRSFPVAVCGSTEERHGIVLAKNYHAKKFGIQTGEVNWQAKQKCPNLIIIPPNYSLYLGFSTQAKNIYRDFTDEIESFGIDECWLDITQSQSLFGSGENIAFEIKNRIKDELGITASIGVSFNKIFAKLGSDMKKPDAVTVMTRENYKQLVWKLPVEDLLYVGRATKRKLNRAAIFTIEELARADPRFLKELLGKWGMALYGFANGQDDSEVSKWNEEVPIKSIGNSFTAPYDICNNEDAKLMFFILAESVGERLRKYHMKGKLISISIKDTMLFSIERQEKLLHPTSITREIASKSYEIFLRTWNWNMNIRSLGIRMGDLVFPKENFQTSIFYDEKKVAKQENLEQCMDKLRERFGHYCVQRSCLLEKKELNRNPVEENVIFPVSYFKDC